jgi:hypothetical protein
MNQAMQDAQAIQNGQITRDQLPDDRKANLDAAMSLAKNTPMDAAQAKLAAYQAIKADVNDLSAKVDESNKSCFSSICVSNFTLAKGWGAAAAAVQATDATADAIRATGWGGPAAVALAKEWEAARGIGENAFAGGAAGAKAFGQGGLVEPAGNPSSAGGLASSVGGEGAGARPPGAGEGGGAETGETAANGLKSAAKLADATLNTYQQPGQMEQFAKGTSSEGGPSNIKRGVELLNGAAEGAEAYNNFNKGETYDGTVSALKSAGSIVNAGGNEQLGGAMKNTADALENFKKAEQAGSTPEVISQGAQTVGNLVKIINKDGGAFIVDSGKLVGTIGQIQSIQATEAQVMQVQGHLTDTVDQRINNMQQFLQLQQMLQGGGMSTYSLP